MPPDGMWVGALRRAVQADPGPLDVTPEAVPMLSSANDRFCRVLENCREPLSAAGVNRLRTVVELPAGAGARAVVSAGAPLELKLLGMVPYRTRLDDLPDDLSLEFGFTG